MALDFPTTPSLNDEYTLNNRTWVFNGTSWDSKNTTLYYSSKYATALTGATGVHVVTHNLNNNDPLVSIWDSDGKLILADITITSANAVSVNFEAAFTGRVVVLV